MSRQVFVPFTEPNFMNLRSDDTADLTKAITVNNEVVGQGGYASVYMGSWKGKPVCSFIYIKSYLTFKLGGSQSFARHAVGEFAYLREGELEFLSSPFTAHGCDSAPT